jgi:chaperonin GroES
MSKIKPLKDRILVQPIKIETKTESGLYIPDTASKEKPQKGKVVAIGTDEKIVVKKDDTVIFAKYAGTEIKVDGEELLLLKEDDILAILE